MKNLRSLAGAAALLALLGAGCAQPAPQGVAPEAPAQPVAQAPDNSPIKIGWLGPLTADGAALGKDGAKAAEMAVEEVNAAGGVNGRMIQLIQEDGQCNPKVASTAGSKLINLDKVVAIVGGLCSGETMAVAPVAEQNKVIMLSACSSAPSITIAGEYIFRSYPSDTFQGKYGAEYVYKTLGLKRVAVLTVQNEWGTGIKGAFIESFKALGGEIVVSEDYTADARDLKAQLAKIKNSNAELIYFVGMTEGSIAGLKQVKEMGLKLPILGGDGWDDVKIHESGYAEGIMYTVAAIEAKDADWKTRLKARGGDTSVCAPRTYDNIKLLVDVMKKVGTDPEKMKSELAQTKDYPGVAGPITFDQNGDVTTADYVIKVVMNKKAEVKK